MQLGVSFAEGPVWVPACVAFWLSVALVAQLFEIGFGERHPALDSLSGSCRLAE